MPVLFFTEIHRRTAGRHTAGMCFEGGENVFFTLPYSVKDHCQTICQGL